MWGDGCVLPLGAFGTKPSGSLGLPAKALASNPALTPFGNNAAGIGGCERTSWVPLATLDRPKPSGTSLEEASGTSLAKASGTSVEKEEMSDIARKCGRNENYVGERLSRSRDVADIMNMSNSPHISD